MLVEIQHTELDFSVRDTITFDAKGLSALKAGRPAGLFYDLDVNLLPQGSYRMMMAPLGGYGRGVSSGFDVIWNLDSLARHHTRLEAEGQILFEGKKKDEFLRSTRAGKEAMLEAFWATLDPDPESPFNDVYLEFQARMAYVQRHLGGFNETGPKDPRGLVYVLLGPPDAVQKEVMPQNFRDQDDAQVKVFDAFAPDREGSTAKGKMAGGRSNVQVLGSDLGNSSGGLPMPYSELAANKIDMRTGSAAHLHAFELWKYDRNGSPLFPNVYSRSSMGSRFLFVDRTGSGDYILESSNTVQGE